jgi:hypothetical protein
MFAARFGKGGAQKSADLVSCPLCRKCHDEMDTYAAGNDDARAAEFMALCWVWLLRNIREGHVVFVMKTLVHEPAPMSAVERKEAAGTIGMWKRRKPKRGSQCTRPSNMMPRNPDRLA